MEDRDILLTETLNLIEKYKVTAYEIEQNTELSAVGVQKIINRETKKPLNSTLKTIMDYIQKKYVIKPKIEGTTISGDNHRINQGGVYNENDSHNLFVLTDKFMGLLNAKDEQIAKKDEQIDKLLNFLNTLNK